MCRLVRTGSVTLEVTEGTNFIMRGFRFDKLEPSMCTRKKQQVRVVGNFPLRRTETVTYHPHICDLWVIIDQPKTPKSLISRGARVCIEEF